LKITALLSETKGMTVPSEPKSQVAITRGLNEPIKSVCVSERERERERERLEIKGC
jgi:hypothetical protein